MHVTKYDVPLDELALVPAAKTELGIPSAGVMAMSAVDVARRKLKTGQPGDGEPAMLNSRPRRGG